MSKKKAERRAAAGPAMDPAAMSYQMSPVPGAPPGPGNMNGNPINVTGLGAQVPSMDGGMQTNLYQDQGGLMYPQMGSESINPMQVPRSMVQQNTPIASRGNNAGQPYGLQMQPPAPMMDQMESGRLAGDAQMRGLPVSAMGLTGMPAIPASIPSEFSGQTGSTMPLTPNPGAGPGAMTPDNMMQQQMGPQPTQTGGTMNMTPNPGPGPGGMTPDNMMAMGGGMAPDGGQMVPGSTKKTVRKKGKK